MGKPHLPAANQLYSVIIALEGVLEKLDQFGAGIAAVHVNAAIEQLRSNLAIVNDNEARAFDISMILQEPISGSNQSRSTALAKDEY